jgi:hypothetical protein
VASKYSQSPLDFAGLKTAAGSPEQLVRNRKSYTAQALAKVLRGK